MMPTWLDPSHSALQSISLSNLFLSLSLSLSALSLIIYIYIYIYAARACGIILAINLLLSSRRATFLDLCQTSSYQGRRHHSHRVTVPKEPSCQGPLLCYCTAQWDDRCYVLGRQVYTVQKLTDEFLWFKTTPSTMSWRNVDGWW